MTEAPVMGTCEVVGGPSGISLDGLPPLPDAEALDAQARVLSGVGAALEEGARAAAGRWSGLAGAYEAPEVGVVLGGFAPVVSKAAGAAGVLSSIAGSLGRYAERSRGLRGRLDGLRGSVAALDALILGNDDWLSKHPILNQHRDTYNEVSALAQEILNSDAECATELRALVGGAAVSAPVVGKLEIGTSKDAFSHVLSHVQHFFGGDAEYPEQPWGPPTPSMRLPGAWAFAQGVASAVLGSVQGVYTLLGTSDVEEQRRAGQALGTLAFAGARTAVAVQRGMRNLSADDVNAIMTVNETVKSALRIGKWENDSAFSAGAVGFDVGSMLVGAGAVVKGGSLGAKAGAVAEDTAAAGSRFIASLDDVASLRGATPSEIRDLIPEGWAEKALKKGDGVRFLNPKRPGESISIENGWPGHADPLHSGPYVKISRDGTIERIPLRGNPVLGD